MAFEAKFMLLLIVFMAWAQDMRRGALLHTFLLAHTNNQIVFRGWF